MPTVKIPPPYRGPTFGTGELQVEAGTVLGCLEATEAKFPGFLAQVLDENGNVHRFVKLFRNGSLLRADALRESVRPDDDLEIIAAIAGG